MFLGEQVEDQKVTAVYFTPGFKVERVALYGLQDGADLRFHRAHHADERRRPRLPQPAVPRPDPLRAVRQRQRHQRGPRRESRPVTLRRPTASRAGDRPRARRTGSRAPARPAPGDPYSPRPRPRTGSRASARSLQVTDLVADAERPIRRDAPAGEKRLQPTRLPEHRGPAGIGLDARRVVRSEHPADRVGAVRREDRQGHARGRDPGQHVGHAGEQGHLRSIARGQPMHVPGDERQLPARNAEMGHDRPGTLQAQRVDLARPRPGGSGSGPRPRSGPSRTNRSCRRASRRNRGQRGAAGRHRVCGSSRCPSVPARGTGRHATHVAPPRFASPSARRAGVWEAFLGLTPYPPRPRSVPRITGDASAAGAFHPPAGSFRGAAGPWTGRWTDPFRKRTPSLAPRRRLEFPTLRSPDPAGGGRPAAVSGAPPPAAGIGSRRAHPPARSGPQVPDRDAEPHQQAAGRPVVLQRAVELARDAALGQDRPEALPRRRTGDGRSAGLRAMSACSGRASRRPLSETPPSLVDRPPYFIALVACSCMISASAVAVRSPISASSPAMATRQRPPSS